MESTGSNISCGVRYVFGIEGVSQSDYDYTMSSYSAIAAIFVTVTTNKETAKFLRKNGWKRYKRTKLFVKHGTWETQK